MLKIGQTIKVDNLKTFVDYYTFTTTVILYKMFNPIYEKIEIYVQGKCKVANDDNVKIQDITGVGMNAYKTDYGIKKNIIVYARIKNLTIHKLEW